MIQFAKELAALCIKHGLYPSPAAVYAVLCTLKESRNYETTDSD